MDDKLFEDQMALLAEQQKFVGASVAYLEDDQLVYANGFGRTTVAAHGIPVTADTLFLYCSVTKMLCATMMMRLVANGLLELDHPIVEYLPRLRFYDVESGARITLRHILSHRTGLPMSGKSYGPQDRDALARFVLQEIPDYRPLSEPGRFVHYSNTVFCIAGYLAEVVTGEYFDDLMQKWLFDPLEMTRSTFKPEVAITYPISLPHQHNEDGAFELRDQFPRNGSGHPSSFCYGTVLDLANVASIYLSGGKFKGQQFLPQTLIEEMWTPQGSCHMDGASHFFHNYYQQNGVGLQLGDYRGIPVVRHPGGGTGFNIFFDMMPEKGRALLFMVNDGGSPGIMETFETIYDHFMSDLYTRPQYAAAWPALPPEPDSWEGLTGRYLSAQFGTMVEIKVLEGELTIHYNDKDRPLRRIGVGQYYCDLESSDGKRIHNIPMAILSDEAGRVEHIILAGEPYQPVDIVPLDLTYPREQYRLADRAHQLK